MGDKSIKRHGEIMEWNRRDFIKNGVLAVAGVTAPFSALEFLYSENCIAIPNLRNPRITKRINLIFDTHYRLDPQRAIPPYSIDDYNKMCDRVVTASLLLKPDEMHLIGDMVDFNPSEWKFVETKIGEMKKNLPNLKIYGLVGNHECVYYPYHLLMSSTDFYSLNEVALKLAAPVLANADTVEVEGDASSVVLNRKMAIVSKKMETDFPFAYDIVTAQHINGNKISFTPPLSHNYAAVDLVRQGGSNRRAIKYFRNAYHATETYDMTSPTDASYATRMGNVLFIFISLNHFHPSPHPRWIKMWPEEAAWFKNMLINNKDCNIVVYTHEPPGSASDIGYPPVYNDWSKETIALFKEICREYSIPLWISGHIHYNWRNGSRIYRPKDYGNTPIVIGPCTLSINGPERIKNGPEDGEFLSMELENGSKNAVIKFYSVNMISGELDRTPIRTETVMFPHAIDLSYKISSESYAIDEVLSRRD